MRGDELARRKLAARLIAARAHLSVRRFTVAQLSYDVVIPIEDTNLAVEIRANHPIALGVKVAGHSQMGFVFDGADVRAGQREGLNAAVSAVSDEQRRFTRAKIDPQTVRRIEFTVAVARASNFSEEVTGARETHNMMRAVAIADKKIAVRSKGDVGWNKIDRPGRVGFIFARIAVRPNWLSIERGLDDFAAVDVAVIELSTDGSTKLRSWAPVGYAPGVWSRIVSAFGSQ